MLIACRTQIVMMIVLTDLSVRSQKIKQAERQTAAACKACNSDSPSEGLAQTG
jgi:hypothetical protein